MQHKILVVDDEESIRFVVKEAFAREYSVFTASDGQMAVEIIKKERPVLVFLDIKMPGVDGIEALRMIKEAGHSTIIWMLTGDEDLDMAVKTLKMGASGYLTKPFDVNKLRDIALNAIIGHENKLQHKSNDKPWQVKKKPK